MNKEYDPRTWLPRYLEKGIAPFALDEGSKGNPPKNWPAIRLTLGDADVAWPNGFGNIADHLEASELPDVDFDHEQAKVAGRFFLPVTHLRYGRPSNPDSHWRYRRKPDARSDFTYEAFPDPFWAKSTDKAERQRAMIIELRFGRHYSLLPPSKYENGERSAWEEFGEPALVEPDELRLAVAKTASAVLLARHLRLGLRHKAVLALSGGLGDASWAEEEIMTLVQACCTVARDEEVLDRLRAVKDTLAKQRAGEPTTGWPTLAQLLGEDIVDTLLRWLRIAPSGTRRQAEAQAFSKSTRAAFDELALFTLDAAQDTKQPATADQEAKRSLTLSANIVRLVKARGAELWHTPGHQAHISVKVGEHLEHYPAQSHATKIWLRHAFSFVGDVAPMLDLLEAEALLAEEHEIHLRLAHHEGAVYLDLADPARRVVKISPEGWEIIANAPVRFRRPPSMHPLPSPERGGSLSELRSFVSLATDDDWVLFLMLLVNPFTRGPYGLGVFTGPKGAAKSTNAKLIKKLIDPSEAMTRTAPRSDQDLMIAAKNNAILILDNLSHVSQLLSDALASLSGEAGYGARKLYANDEESLIVAKRPVLITSIHDVVTAPDLLDRSIVIAHERLTEAQTRTELEYWAAFEEARPRILGALLDAVSVGLKNLATKRLASMPRMADWATFCIAAEPALGLAQGTLQRVYQANRRDASLIAVSSDPLSRVVIELLNAIDSGVWQGTPSALHELLEALAQAQPGYLTWFPKVAHTLSSRLKAIAPDLRELGIEVISPKRTGRQRLIRLSRRSSLTLGQPGDAASDASDASMTLDIGLASHEKWLS